MLGSDGLRILKFEKRSWLRFGLGRGKSIFGALRGQTSCLQRGAARGGVIWKNQHRKKLCLSLLMSKNLKLKKVIKSFVPEPKKRVVRVFRVFSDSYVYEHLWTFSVSVWICLFHISVSQVYIYIFLSKYFLVDPFILPYWFCNTSSIDDGPKSGRK